MQVAKIAPLKGVRGVKFWLLWAPCSNRPSTLVGILRSILPTRTRIIIFGFLFVTHTGSYLARLATYSLLRPRPLQPLLYTARRNKSTTRNLFTASTLDFESRNARCQCRPSLHYSQRGVHRSTMRKAPPKRKHSSKSDRDNKGGLSNRQETNTSRKQ